MIYAVAAACMLRWGAPKPLEVGYLSVSPVGPSVAFTMGPYGWNLWILKAESNRFRLLKSQQFEVLFDTVMFAPNGQYLAAAERNGSGDSDVYLLSTRTMRLIGRLHGCADYALLAFSRDSRYVYGCAYGTAFKWRTRDGKLVAKWAPFGSSEITGDLFESSGEIAVRGNVFEFLAGQHKKKLVLADGTLKTVAKRTLPSDSFVIRPLSLGGRRLGYQKRDPKSLDLVDLNSLASVTKVTKPEIARAADVYPFSIKVSPSGGITAARTVDRKQLQLWPTLHPSEMRAIGATAEMVGQDFYFVNEGVLAMAAPGELTDAKTGGRLLQLKLTSSGDRGVAWSFAGPKGEPLSDEQAIAALRAALARP